MLIASTDAGVRRAWRRCLGPLAVCREATDHAGLTEAMAEPAPSLVLLDLALNGLGGVVGVLPVRRLNSTSRIIAFTDAPSDKEGAFALMAGASGYCPKEMNGSLLRKAVRVVRNGELWVGRKLTHYLLGELSLLTEAMKKMTVPDQGRWLDALSRRERDIARLLGHGSSNREIGKELGITERTVKTHLTSIFRKLGVSDRLNLALLIKGAGTRPGAAGDAGQGDTWL